MRALFASCSVLVAGLLVAFTVPMAGQAQDEPSSQSALAVSPAIMEEALTSGKDTPFTIQVHNVTNFPLPVKTSVKSLVPQKVELEVTEQARLDASSWFVVDEPDFILQPKAVHTVSGTLRPPQGAIPGGHYATIYFQPLIPQEALSPSTAYMNARVGVLAFLVVKGDITQSAEFAKPLAAPGLVARGPVDFSFTIRNTGNVHIMPSGTLRIYDWQNKQVGEEQLPVGVILPDTTKEYSLSWKAAAALGSYHATLQISYGDEHSLDETQVTVWVLPWIEIVLSVTILAAIVVVVIRTRRRWRSAWRALRGNDTHFRIK